MLRIEHLCKSFGEKKVVDALNLTVKPGEIAVLLGSSGVGKSTVLRLLNNLETVDCGTVFLNEKKLDLNQVHQMHQIGMVFQQFHLFEHLTVERNITLALEKVLKKSPEQAREIAHMLLKKYGLIDKAGYAVSDLSGGQKQRLAIVRSLAVQPTVICFDEPTSALDPLLTAYVAEQIQALADDNYIVLVATHDMSLLERLKCTIYLMRDGKIIESASSTDFWQHPDGYPQIKNFVAGID